MYAVRSGIIIRPMIEIPSTNSVDLNTTNAIELFMAYLADIKLPDVSRVLLYGSRARGEHQDNSDVDLAVVLPGADPGDGTLFNLLQRLAAVSSRIMLEMERPLNVEAFIVWEDELSEPEDQYNPDFYRNVLADGIEVKPVSH